MRSIKVHLIVGPPGSGKSYHYPMLCEQHGEENVYMMSDYQNGGLDHYAAEPILVMDEFKGQLPFAVFLAMTDIYKVQIHARYANVWALWQEVYITSVYSPEDLYTLMVPLERQTVDSIGQMLRRITDITYCYNEGADYQRYTIPMSAYRGLDQLKADAMSPGHQLILPDTQAR